MSRRGSSIDDALLWLSRTTRRVRAARSTPKPLIRLIVRRKVYRAQRRATRKLLKRVGF